MQTLFEYSNRLISNVDKKFTRYLYNTIHWENKLIGIVGPRGVGKTTLVLQYIKNNLDVRHTLYVSAEDFYFAKHRLSDDYGNRKLVLIPLTNQGIYVFHQ